LKASAGAEASGRGSPGLYGDLLKGVKGSVDPKAKAAEDKGQLLCIPKLVKRHSYRGGMTVGGLLHIDQKVRGGYVTFRVGIMPTSFPLLGIFHSGFSFFS
jgi:hypothetical protein